MAKSYVLGATKHPMVFRLIDRGGNWKHYILVKKFTDAFMQRMANVGKSEKMDLGPSFSDLVEYVVLDGVTTILNGGYVKGAFFDTWLLKHTQEERDQILSSAGDRGDMVHRIIDLVLSSGKVLQEGSETVPFVLDRDTQIYNKETAQEEPISNDVWDCLLAFESFSEAHGIVVYASELTLYNTLFKYGGTADAVLMLTKACGVKSCKCAELVGKIGLWDWKSSSGIRASYGGQVGAYNMAENIGEYLPPAQQLAYSAILRLGTAHVTTGGYEMAFFSSEHDGDPEFKSKSLYGAFQRFLGAKRIFEYEAQPFDPEDVKDIPDHITITAPLFDMEAARAEAEKLAKEEVKVAQVKSLDIDLNKLKVGAWIRTAQGDVAQVENLEDDGMVSFTSPRGSAEKHHYTLIKEIFDREADALSAPAWKEPDMEEIDTPLPDLLPSNTLGVPMAKPAKPKKKPLKKVTALKKKMNGK